jgi:hypothetical protein
MGQSRAAQGRPSAALAREAAADIAARNWPLFIEAIVITERWRRLVWLLDADAGLRHAKE